MSFQKNISLTGTAALTTTLVFGTQMITLPSADASTSVKTPTHEMKINEGVSNNFTPDRSLLAKLDDQFGQNQYHYEYDSDVQKMVFTINTSRSSFDTDFDKLNEVDSWMVEHNLNHLYLLELDEDV
ncbi:hypothetical protein EQG49_11650 [Periweissella cryptocerci]|uniref:Uncharacterized protein n=1 Tax=Periweissella cryptocerci TaxID=2506420 RepID=A0A4P6YWA0_9LACO|nr:hypothetical protein [Periweissella cryptocerci]QBO37061.1 hypothetical protein EQG49_11650 [Periweissella cryptocerci]